MSDLAAIQKKRADRKAALKLKEDAQKAIDLEAIDRLEQELGDSNVAVMHVPYTEGLPTLVAVRAPTKAETKRYRDQVRPKHDKHKPDAAAAAENVAALCRVYPAQDVYELMCDARAGLHSQAGVLAINLAVGTSDDEGKE